MVCGARRSSARGQSSRQTGCSRASASDHCRDIRAWLPSSPVQMVRPCTTSPLSLGVELQSRTRHLVGAMSARLDEGGVALHRLAGDLTTASRAAIERRGNRISAAAAQLHALSPLATLARGYAIAQSDTGRTLASV